MFDLSMTKQNVFRVVLRVSLAFFVLLGLLVLRLERFVKSSSHDWLIRAGHLKHRLLQQDNTPVNPDDIDLDPTDAFLGSHNSTAAVWQFPPAAALVAVDKEKEKGGGNGREGPTAPSPRGLYLLFHGCNHDPLDFFALPEDRRVTRHLLARGYVVLALGSLDRRGRRCWGHAWPPEENPDLVHTVIALNDFYKKFPQTKSLPLFAFGASSGGAFATLLPAADGPRPRGLAVQISAGHTKAIQEEHKSFPPTVFVHMPRDEQTAALVLKRKELLAMEGIPALELQCKPHSISPEMLQAALPDVGPPEWHIALFNALHGEGLHDCHYPLDDYTGCLLTANAAELRTYVGGDGLLLERTLQHVSEELLARAGVPPGQDPGKNDIRHKVAEVAEILKAAHGTHELTSEHTAVWEGYLWHQYQLRHSSAAAAALAKEADGVHRRSLIMEREGHKEEEGKRGGR